MSCIKILVVEDEQLVADDLRETLELLGYTVSGLASTGEMAIAQIERLPPDLVLMDIRLGGAMDGIVASAQIRARFQIPVIYLTANADRTTLDRAKATYPFGYILKPFDDRSLATTIEIALARHQAEAAVQHSLIAAEQKQQVATAEIAQKSRVISHLSHELRNPLTTIQFALEALQHSEGLPAEKRQRYFHRMQEAIHSLSYLLESVLQLEKAGAGQVRLSLTDFDVIRFCQDQVEAFQFCAGDRHTLSFTTALTEGQVTLDEALLWHLLNNLLSNAIKYSPQGGTITLKVARDATHLHFQVSDSGIGIPADDLAQLFEPFHRASNVADIAGTGLGLAIAKQCVDLHHGEIAVVSTLGQGTVFTARLPLLTGGDIGHHQ